MADNLMPYTLGTVAKAGGTKEQERNNVAKWSAVLLNDHKRHELAITLRAGVEAMREKALHGKYMKPNPGELEPVVVGNSGQTGNNASVLLGDLGYTLYELRLERSALMNVWANTIRDIARLPFRSRIDLEGWGEELAGRAIKDERGNITGRIPGWVDNFNGEGLTFEEWAAEAFEDALFEGVVYGFVDNDPREFQDPGSRRLAGAQPRCIKLQRGDIRRMTFESGPGGVPRLKQLVFCSPLYRSDTSNPNAWFEECVDAYRVVTAGDLNAPPRSPERKVKVQVYAETEEGEYEELPDLAGWITPDNPSDELTEIPLIPLYSQRTSPYRGDSPFLDTAWEQNAIWNHLSELQNKGREAALSFLHESGVIMAEEKPGRGSSGNTQNPRFRWSTKEGARLSLVETDGSAMAAIKDLIEYFKTYIRDAHHQIRSERPSAAVTAREITINGVQAASALEMWIVFQESGWQKILEMMSLLGGLSERGTVTIPHDFGLPNTGMERNKELFVAGAMSPFNYWNEALRAGDVDEKNFDIEEEYKAFARRQLASQVEALKLLLSWNSLSKFSLWEILVQHGALPEDFNPIAEERRLDAEANDASVSAQVLRELNARAGAPEPADDEDDEDDEELLEGEEGAESE